MSDVMAPDEGPPALVRKERRRSDASASCEDCEDGDGFLLASEDDTIDEGDLKLVKALKMSMSKRLASIALPSLLLPARLGLPLLTALGAIIAPPAVVAKGLRASRVPIGFLRGDRRMGELCVTPPGPPPTVWLPKSKEKSSERSWSSAVAGLDMRMLDGAP